MAKKRKVPEAFKENAARMKAGESLKTKSGKSVKPKTKAPKKGSKKK